jgi:hypothetical protein
VNTNSAIVQIVLNAAEQIRYLALDAIDRLPEVQANLHFAASMGEDEDGVEIVPAVMEPFNEVVARAREAMAEVRGPGIHDRRGSRACVYRREEAPWTPPQDGSLYCGC